MASGLDIIDQIEEHHHIILKDFQKSIYLKILHSLDVFVCAQTGSAKTYCFPPICELFSLVHKAEWPIDNKFLTSRISPLSSLMLKQASRLNDLEIDAKFIGKLQSDPLVQESVVQGRLS